MGGREGGGALKAIIDMLLAVGLIFGVAWFSRPKQQSYPDRCEVCGYLKDGPLHNDQECASHRRAMGMTDDELRTEGLYAQNRDIFGF